MKNPDDAILELTVIFCLCVIIVFMFAGCASVKYSLKSYYPDGQVKSDIAARYDRIFNQEIGIAGIENDFISVYLEEQKADNTEVTGELVSGVVEGIGKVVTPGTNRK